MMTQFHCLYHVYLKWLSCVNVICQLHVDMEMERSKMKCDIVFARVNNILFTLGICH